MGPIMLASELTEKTLWNPTIVGILVAISAVVLFFGSIYLLLGSNVGARLGFLVAAASLTGFLVLLTSLWVMTAFPLNVMKGRLPSWEVIGVFDTFDNVPDDVRGIRTDGHTADPVEAADVKAEIDETIVTHSATGSEELSPGVNDNAIFANVTEFQVTDTFLQGGSDPNLLKLEATHTPLFAAAEFCENLEVDVLPGLPPPEPVCDPNGESGVIVLERNLGSVRFPPFAALVVMSLLFGLSLLGLHWYERDQRATKKETTSTGGAR